MVMGGFSFVCAGRAFSTGLRYARKTLPPRKIQMWKLAIIPCVVFFVAGPGAAYGAEEAVGENRWNISAGGSYSRGSYGLSEKTTIGTIYSSGRYRADFWEVSVYVPYLFVTGPSTPEEGAITGDDDGGKSSVNGIGDIWLRGRYYLRNEGELFQHAPAVDVLAGFKVPVADQDKGLGTGEPDCRIGVGFLKRAGNFILMSDFQYEFRGQPSGTDLKNRFISSLGAGYPVHEKGSLYVFFDGRTQSVKGAEAPAEVTLLGNWKVKPELLLQAYVGAGLTEGSPDHFAGVAIRRSFGRF